MPRRKRASRPVLSTPSSNERSEVVFKFRFLGVPLAFRPPRIVELGKALLGAVPAIVGIVLTLIPAFRERSAATVARNHAKYHEELAGLPASDSKSRAEVVFTRLLKSDSSDLVTRERYLDYLVAKGDRTRAMAILSAMTRKDAKSNPIYHFRLANMLLSEPAATDKQLLDAERHLRRTIELDSGEYAILARRKIALIEVRKGDLAAAFKTLEPIMTESPVAGAEALWLAWSGNLEFDANATDRVLDRLERDLRAQRVPNPDNVLAKLRLLVIMGRSAEAAEWFALQKTLAPEARKSIDSEFAEMQLVSSMKNSADGTLPDWSKLERVLERKPDDPIWLSFVVSIWAGPVRIGTEPAKLWVQSRLDDDSANDFLLRQALVALSGQYEVFGRTAEDSRLLRKLYRNFLKRFPEDAVAMNNLAVLIYKHEPENLEEGLRLAQEADRLAPDQPAIQETIGQLLARSGRIDQARTILEKCLGPLPEEWGLHNTLVQIYEKSGDTALAKAHRELLAKLPRPADAGSFEKLNALKQ
ncbi:hypothetical protein GC170_21045 [bacterium]|nr:hypothetical protein [bacterium]